MQRKVKKTIKMIKQIYDCLKRKTKIKSTNIMSKIIINLLIISVISNSTAFGQEIHWGNTIGLLGGVNQNLHNVAMSPIFNAPTPVRPTFNKDFYSTTGFFGIEGNFQISSLAVITARVGYNFAGVDFSHKPSAATTNTAKTKLNYLEIAPMFKLVNALPFARSLYFTTGVNVGFPLANSYDFTQQRVSAATTRQIGNIPDAQLRVSLPVGIGYIYKITGRVSIIPEISYSFDFSDIVQGAGVSSNPNWQSWNFQQVKAGLSLAYSLQRHKTKEKPKFVDSSFLSARISEVYTYLRNDEKQPVSIIQLEEAEYGEYFPIIPYIFYSVNETELAPQYRKKQKKAETVAGYDDGNEDESVSDAIEVNEQILDIIAQRMQQNRNANLTITGTIDGRVETEPVISRYRALGVRKYLLDNYSIDSNRINIRFGAQPSKPSAYTVQDGLVENRRVELSSNSPVLFEPVFMRGEKQRVASPDNIVFVPEVNSNRPIVAWDLEITQADRIVRRFFGDSIVPVKWYIRMNELQPSQMPLEYKYSVYTDDDFVRAEGRISLDYSSYARKITIDQPDKTIHKYSLVLFDFDSPVVTDQNRAIIDKFIIPNIKFGSVIDIYGYTDRIGVSEYNQRLSMARANAVRDYIRTRNRNVSINTFGLGDSAEIFNNNYPIGRQLSRTVQILVVTPK